MENITLVGAEDVSSAARAMQQAAHEMKEVASEIEDSFRRQRVFMDEWLKRLEVIFKEVP